ncbi:MAG: hypothetical protein KKH98_15945, partial [Spirochaetes bacterium]|nr:hypothetical protein [Spirochaetota bacterium]
MWIKIIIIVFTLISTIYGETSFGGELKLSQLWYVTGKEWEMSGDNYQLLDINMKNEDSRQFNYKVRFQTRVWDHSDLSSSDDLNTMGNLITYKIIPWEMWVQLNDIPFKRLSLKAGKQYFEWGTADGIHPTSVLNPDDYTDPFAMNEKIPVNAFNLNYYFSSFKLFLIWIPSFTPVRMPRFFPFISKEAYSIAGMELLKIEDELKQPSQLADGMGKAVKLQFSLFNIDYSMGYFHGYDYMPAVRSLNYIPAGNMFSELDLKIKMFFPKMQVYTFDWTTSIEGFGFFGEVGVYGFE